MIRSKNWKLVHFLGLDCGQLFNLEEDPDEVNNLWDEPKVSEIKDKLLTSELKDLENKISLVKNNDIDYLDMLYREKFKYGTKDEIIIKLK